MNCKHILGLTLLGASLMATSCSSSRKVVYMQQAPELTAAEMQVKAGEVKVLPGDQLSIMVLGPNAETSVVFNKMEATSRLTSQSTGNGVTQNSNLQGYRVDTQGYIDMPVLGKVHVAGLTREQIQTKVAELLTKGDYLTNPVVTVEFMNLHFSVLGEVKQPGNYAISNDQITLLEALAQAGDLTIYGKRSPVVVTRVEGNERKQYTVDLLSNDLFTSPAYYLQQNDVIYVQPNSTRAGQSSINENSLKSVSMWISIASFITSITVLIVR